jgi:hypothetical protein
MVPFMTSPWAAIALVAGVTAATTAASAQPILSPRDVPDPAAPAPARSAQPAPLVAPAPPAKPARSTAPAQPTKSAKSTKSAQSAKPTKSAMSTKSKSAKSAKPARSTKLARSTKSAAPSGSGSRVALAASRGGRGGNMPRGFSWPATPAMQAAAKACEADLDALGVTWKPSTAEGRIVDPIEVPDGILGGIKYTSAWRSPPHKLDCQLARALARVGRDLHAIGVREVRWGSIYRWSNVRTQGTTLPYLSRHALGLAMDIVEFIDDTGRVANVQHDYLGGDSLLAGIEQLVNTSGRFRILLTPKNDPKSHHDHFHVEANPDYSTP